MMPGNKEKLGNYYFSSKNGITFIRIFGYRTMQLLGCVYTYQIQREGLHGGLKTIILSFLVLLITSVLMKPLIKNLLIPIL